MSHSIENQKHIGIQYRKLTTRLEKLLEWRNYLEAKDICDEHLLKNPQQPEIQLFLLNATLMLGHKEEALQQLDLLIRSNPERIDFLVQKLNLLNQMGDTQHTRQMIDVLRAQGIDFPMLTLIEAQAGYQSNDFIGTIELADKVLTDPITRQGTRIKCLYLKGSAYDKLNEPDKAISAFNNANRLENVTFRKQEFTEFADRLIKVYSKNNLKYLPRSSNNSDRPVFLLCMPRSGSSLINQIIDSHPNAYGVGETGYFVHRRWELKKEHGTDYPGILQTSTTNQLDQYATGYLEGAGKPDFPEALRTLDKSIDNFRDLGLIWQTFPNARYINLQRNSLDCCFSIYQHQFDSPNIQHYTGSFEDIGYVYNQHERLKKHWIETLDIHVLNISYEDITAGPEGQIRRILNFLELPWDKNCLRFYETKRGINTLSANQVQQKIYRHAVGKAEKYEKYIDTLKKVLEINKD